mgnify:CR=1 FL=1
MTEEVKPRRAYRSARRQQTAADTRSAILAAAQAAFLRDGWTRTTIASIAREAAVAPETIYSVFGNKRALIQALVQSAVRGALPDVPLLQQAVPRAIGTASDQSAQLAMFAGDIVMVLERVAPLVAVVREAARAEPELEQLYRDLHAGRRRNLAFVAEALAGRGPLRGGMGTEEATAIVWRLASPELFTLARNVEGLSSAGYRQWLESSLRRLLLDEDA